jgi:N-methylhydantoinase A/acetophenone carboxylase
MGGTSFDIGYIRKGEPSYSLQPNIEGFDCNVPMLSILGLGAGGGSIASVVQGRLQVGPQSAGALPGPACFDLGGTEPTVTDANLVLGLLDPDYFLGGHKRLHAGKASAALEKSVAGPLEISVHEAALLIKARIDGEVGRSIARLCQEEGRGVEALMVIYGGAGPLHACEIAELSGIKRIVVTPYSAVFSAYSSSLIDVGHFYHQLVLTPLEEENSLEAVEKVAAQMKKRSIQDMRGEGFAEGQLEWQMELILRNDQSGEERKIRAALNMLEEPGASIHLREVAEKELKVSSDTAITIVNVGVLVKAPIPHFRQQPHPDASGTAEEAIRGHRQVYVGGNREFCLFPVYDRSRLGSGHVLPGPALVDSEQTTVLVNAGWRLRIDAHDNSILEREEDAA